MIASRTLPIKTSCTETAVPTGITGQASCALHEARDGRETRPTMRLPEGVALAPRVKVVFVFPHRERHVLRVVPNVFTHAVVADPPQQCEEAKAVQFAQARLAIGPPFLELETLAWFHLEAVCCHISLRSGGVRRQHSRTCLIKVRCKWHKSVGDPGARQLEGIRSKEKES